MPADYICPEVAKLRAALAASEGELKEAREKILDSARETAELCACIVDACRTVGQPPIGPLFGVGWNSAIKCVAEKIRAAYRKDDTALASSGPATVLGGHIWKFGAESVTCLACGLSRSYASNGEACPKNPVVYVQRAQEADPTNSSDWTDPKVCLDALREPR